MKCLECGGYLLPKVDKESTKLYSYGSLDPIEHDIQYRKYWLCEDCNKEFDGYDL